MRKFVVVVEEAEGNYSAYSPDLPGCVATGATVDGTMRNMVEAIHFHLEGCEGAEQTVCESHVISANIVYA
ncbi:MAG TPA: type II toxin-antitoxin system HicB family antitoxin [Spirochaetia bacterium]